MKYPKYSFKAYPAKANKKTFWVAESLELKGGVGQGASSNEAIAELANNEDAWIEAAGVAQIPIPDAIIADMDFEMPPFPNLTGDVTFSEGVTTTNYKINNIAQEPVTLTILYRSITATLEYDPEGKVVYGKLDNVDPETWFYGNNVGEAEDAFKREVEKYYDNLHRQNN